MKTLAKIHTENRAREAALIRSALEGYGWNLSRAAALLGVTYSRLRGILERGRHPELWAEYQARNPGKGRPVTKSAS